MAEKKQKKDRGDDKDRSHKKDRHSDRGSDRRGDDSSRRGRSRARRTETKFGCISWKHTLKYIKVINVN